MSELTTEAISKILREKFPPKMIEVEGETVVDPSDPQTVYSSIIVSLARRVEASGKSLIALSKQVGEVLVVLKAIVPRLARLESIVLAHNEAPTETPQAQPPVASAPSVVQAPVEETEEEGPPVPNVRASAASSVMPNPTPGANGRS